MFLYASSGAASASVSSSSIISPGAQLLAVPLLQLDGWMFACPAHCLLLLVPLQVGTALHGSATAKAFSAGVVEGLERDYLQTAKWFVAGSWKPNKTTCWCQYLGCNSCEAITEKQEDFYPQSVGFKMLGEDSNTLDEGRECGVKDE